ncbi:UTP--glucose-1-phosphate uridylyltransferase [Propionimicrobium sp. PCR01-08-3]|uniref:UTP--glucose-1-phosphate uridylyltransferase n=1 Tax=Propionimicrobium sp. PCR01-08-3 TaxID=3052086 RepID=UPI00255D0685|nr:UTP--glucose-1-phosphate uridylyltransferase [Propionimicrobium sp. PCR01-08-3]WIY83071.1 UTP--glucose-1-phosphate uridylyltransferase [Propionimicrobium sp. PCR01-08-3]
MTDPALDAAIDKLRADGAAPSVIAAFVDRFQRLASGETGYLHEADLKPLTDPPMLADQQLDEHAAQALAQTAVVRLNGGLGTSMGLAGPKCLIPVRDGLTFLDIVVRQILALREAHGVRLPLLLMNSYNTSQASLDALARYPELPVEDLPLEFVQSREPKLLADTRMPVEWPANPGLEWCPPGHGDFYPSLYASGLITKLLDEGFRYLFVANMDNLGAVPDPRLAGWFAASGAPYAAEVTERTDMDRKGGHLAHRIADGRLVLRDTAQVSPDEMDSFIDIVKHPWTHTNNLWLDLQQVVEVLDANQGAISLPLIINRKTVDPADAGSPAVVQLEGAIGAAVEVFDGAQAIGVPRSRFLPVKATADLLVLRSDIYEFTDDALLVGREISPVVRLDPDYYKLIGDFEQHFPAGPPSLTEAHSLQVTGDFTFGKDVVVRGDAVLTTEQPQEIPEGAVVEN